MRHFTRHYEELIERFSQWAATEEDVRAAAIIGSRARLNDRPADEWADLDVLIITNTPDRFLAESDWLAQIGTPILTFVETTATGNEKERRVLFDGGLDVDFAIIPRENIQALLLHEIPSAFVLELMNVFGRGMRILADKDGLIEQLMVRLQHVRRNPYCRRRKKSFRIICTISGIIRSGRRNICDAANSGGQSLAVICV